MIVTFRPLLTIYDFPHAIDILEMGPNWADAMLHWMQLLSARYQQGQPSRPWARLDSATDLFLGLLSSADDEGGAGGGDPKGIKYIVSSAGVVERAK